MVREIEDLLIECIYNGLLQGRLDQQERHLEVFSCAGRDVRARHPAPFPGGASVGRSSPLSLDRALPAPLRYFLAVAP